MSNYGKKDLKSFVRVDGSGRVVAGSLVLRRKIPKTGRWKQLPTYPTGTIVQTVQTDEVDEGKDSNEVDDGDDGDENDKECDTDKGKV